MTAPRNLHDVFVEELKDLHHAEQPLVHALPTMAAAAAHEELKEAFREHLDQTEVHVLRLDHIARAA